MKIEENRIYNIDCLDGMRLMKEQGVKADCIITDMPYGIEYRSPRTDNHHILQNDGFKEWCENMPKWLAAMSEVITDTGVCCCCCGGGGKTPVTAIMTMEAIKHFHLIQTLVWEKTIGLGWRYRPQYENILILSKSKDNYAFYDTSKKCGNIIKCNQVIPKAGDHPTQKPLDLIYRLLQIHTREGDLVLDAFMGGGTTAIACHKMNRRFIGFEIDKGYYELSQRRLREATAQMSLWDLQNIEQEAKE